MKPNATAKVETIYGVNGIIHAGGSVGQRLLKNKMNVNALRPWVGKNELAYMDQQFINNEGKPALRAVPIANATLRKDEWKEYDQAILRAAQQRLIGVADLYNAGLVYRTGNGLGTTVLEYEDMSDIEAAQISMDGVTRGRRDRPEFDINYLPLPIIHSDFYLNIRVLSASRTTGAPLDTTMAELAGRKVAEKAEEILFQGSSTFAYGGGTIYGYADAPQRNTVTLDATWDDSAKTGEQILQDVKDMKQASIDAYHYGPWVLYIPTSYETVLDGEFKSNSDKAIRTRLMEMKGITDIKVADFLSADTVVLVQMTSDVVRLVEGLSITTVEWDTEGGMTTNFKVMAIMVPQIRNDQNNRSGITVLA